MALDLTTTIEIKFGIVLSFNEMDYRTAALPTTERAREKMSLLNDKKAKVSRKNFQPKKRVSARQTPKELGLDSKDGFLTESAEAGLQDSNPISKAYETITGTLWGIGYTFGSVSYPIHQRLTTKELKSMLTNGPINASRLATALGDIDDKLAELDSSATKYTAITLSPDYTLYQLMQNIHLNKQIFEDMEIWNTAETFIYIATHQEADDDIYDEIGAILVKGGTDTASKAWQAANLNLKHT